MKNGGKISLGSAAAVMLMTSVILRLTEDWVLTRTSAMGVRGFCVIFLYYLIVWLSIAVILFYIPSVWRRGSAMTGTESKQEPTKRDTKHVTS